MACALGSIATGSSACFGHSVNSASVFRHRQGTSRSVSSSHFCRIMCIFQIFKIRGFGASVRNGRNWSTSAPMFRLSRVGFATPATGKITSTAMTPKRTLPGVSDRLDYGR